MKNKTVVRDQTAGIFAKDNVTRSRLRKLTFLRGENKFTSAESESEKTLCSDTSDVKSGHSTLSDVERALLKTNAERSSQQ